jgi:hypothetical protein
MPKNLKDHTAGATEEQASHDCRPLPIDTATQARTILHHLLEHGDVASCDAAGHTVITLAVDAGAEDHENSGDRKPNNDAEENRPPSSL